MHSLPLWIEQWLGVDPNAAGEGTSWTLEHSWAWAPWVTLVFSVLAVLFVIAIYWLEKGPAARWTRGCLALLRCATIGLVMLMLAEWILGLHRTGLPYVVVLVDDSASMNTVDRIDDEKFRAALQARLKLAGFNDATRLNVAKTLLIENDAELLRQIADNYKLRVYFVSDTARAQSSDTTTLQTELRALEATGQASRLGQGLRNVLNDLRGTPPAAIIFLTDGVTTEGETLSEAAGYARRKGVPLFAIGLGSESAPRDLELADLLVDEVVFADDIINFEFTLFGSGLAGRSVDVTLKEKSSDKPLAKRTVNIGADGQPQKLRLPYRTEKVGEYEFTIEVDKLPEETRHDNNRLAQVVSVRDEPIKVLLVQEYPNYEFRYLKELLGRDKTIRLHYLQQDADVDFVERTKQGERMSLSTFPVRREELFEYDVILFGDVNPALLSASALQNVTDFVKEKGGGIIFVAGPEHMPLAYRNTPLAEIIPIDLTTATVPDGRTPLVEGFRVEPTDAGLAKPQMQLGDSLAETGEIWQQRLDKLYWLLEIGRLKPVAQSLAEHPHRVSADGRKLPIFIYAISGAGKVLFHATDDTWRWRARVGDVYFGRYWIQAIRYLGRSKLLGKDKSARLFTDRTKYSRGEPVRVQVRFIDERQAPADERGVTVMFERTGQSRRQVTLARSTQNRSLYEGQITKLTEGTYHAWIVDPAVAGEPATDFQVLPPAGETARSQMDAVELARAAAESKGKFYRLNTVSRLLDDLPSGNPVPIESLPSMSLWNRWPVLLLFLVLLIGEWLLRKRVGML